MMAKSRPIRFADKDNPIYTGRFTFSSHLTPQLQPENRLLPSVQKAKEEDE